MTKRDYFVIDPKDIFEDRHILDTKRGETRYFLFEDEVPIKATAPEDGGLEIEKYIDGEPQPGADIIPRLLQGADLEEIDEDQFLSLTKK